MHEGGEGGRIEVVVGDRAVALRRRALAAVIGHVVRRVGDGFVGAATAEEAGDVLGPGRIAGEEPMPPKDPQVAGLRQGFPGRGLEGSIEVECLRALALFARIETAQEGCDLVLAEAREPEIDTRRVLELSEEPGQELFVPAAGDLVEGQPEGPGFGRWQVDEDDRNAGQARPASGNEALVAGHDRPVEGGKNRLDDAVVTDAPGQGVELVLVDPARVRWVWPELLDRDLAHLQRGCRA